MAELSIGVGKSNHNDSHTAGYDAATGCLHQLGTTPDVLIVFGASHFDQKRLLKGIVSVTGDIPMLGGTTAGEISNAGISSQSVVIMGLSSPDFEFTTGIGPDMNRDEEACGAALVKHLLEKKKNSLENPLALIVFPDGLGGDGVKVIRGLHRALDRDVEIVGGFLGDAERFKDTTQYYNGKVYKNTIPGLLICGKTNRGFKTGIGVGSGFESIGNRFYCTASEGNIVKEFDNERALDLYKKFLGEERAQRLPGICLEYPFGLIDEKVSVKGKEYFQLRCGLTVDHEKGTIHLAGSIPTGSAITLTTGLRKDIIRGAEQAARQAQEYLNGANPQMVLMFSCVGRKLVLGRRTHEEVAAVKKILGDIPLIGFYTYGEIGPIDKTTKELAVTKFHNETVVLWVLGTVPEA